MAAWIYPTSVTGNQVIIRKDSGGGGYFLRLSNANLQSLFSYGGGFTQNSLGTVNLNQWQHVVALYDGASIRHYINGVQAGSIPTNMSLSFNNANVSIGKTAGSAANEYFNGKIDDARLYNRALSAAEIKLQYESYDSQINLNSTPTNTVSGGNIGQGLVGYWPFSGNAKDATPYGNNGSVNGASLALDRSGNANNAYGFNGTGIISILQNSNHDVDVGQVRTASAWFKADTTSGSRMVLSKNSNCTGWYIILNNSGHLQVEGDYGSTNCTGGTFATSSATDKRYDDGAWHMVTVVIDRRPSSSLSLYVDGQQKQSSALNNTFSGVTSSGLRIGAHTTNGSNMIYNFSGAIDEVRIYDRALSTNDISALYQANN